MFVAMTFCSYVAKHSRDMLLPATERTVLDLNSLIYIFIITKHSSNYSQTVIEIKM